MKVCVKECCVCFMQSSIPLTTGNSADLKRSALPNYRIPVIWLDTWRSWDLVYSVATPFPSPCDHSIRLTTPIDTHARLPERSSESDQAGAQEAQVRYAIFDEGHISYSCLLFFVPGSARVHRSSFILARRDLLAIHLSHSHTVSSMDYATHLLFQVPQYWEQVVAGWWWLQELKLLSWLWLVY